jgi:hypothetical protein
MDLRTLTKLLLKLIGLYWLIGALVGAISLATTIGSDSTPYRFPTFIGYFIVGGALVWFPGPIANRVLHIEGAEHEGAITAAGLLDVGIALLGVYFTVVAVSALIFSIGGFGELGDKYDHEQLSAFVAWIVQLLIGLTLMFARRRVVKLIERGNDR